MKTLILHAATLLLLVPGAFSQTQTGAHHDFTVYDSSDPAPQMPSSNKLCSPASIQSISPLFSFNDNPYNHNMHIASDGDFYYTINGGSATYGQISVFSLTGQLIQTYPIQLDGRGLSYNPADSSLYASTYPGDVVKINDYAAGTFTVIFPAIMQNDQASFAISSDGTKFYDFYQGTLLIHDFTTGAILNTLTGFSYGSGNYGGEAAVAVDSAHIYTCDATTRTIYTYDQSGSFMQSTVLDSGDNGMSLAVMNNYLFLSRDGNYSTGTWYAYNLSAVTGVTPVAKSQELNVYPNPANDRITITAGYLGQGIPYYIADAEGKQVASGMLTGENTTVDLHRFASGMYTVQVGQQDRQTFKVLKK